MRSESISLKDAQRLIFSSQKLSGEKLDPIQIIEHLGYVQIDAISVVERAHHHVIWTRNHAYRAEMLDSLVNSRKIFEYWSHAASYIPMKDYRYSLPIKNSFKNKSDSWCPRDAKLMAAIKKRIKNEGPLLSKDFKNTKTKNSTGWWDWKPAKMALERLFLEGHLEITRRDGFQKVYDLPENVIPGSIDTSTPTPKEFTRFLIQRTLRNYGLAVAEEIAYLGTAAVKADIIRVLEEMLEAGEIIKMSVEGLNKPYYMFPSALENLPRIKSEIVIMSPFDSLVIQRKRLLAFFNFNYQIECYVPVKKRKYGYFCLPVFMGALPIARIDCKADRKNQNLNINSIHHEKNTNRKFPKDKLESKLRLFAKFNQCKSICR